VRRVARARRVEIADDDACAFLGEPRRDREADALRRAGDDGDAILETWHA
jgi:hypothetical protein